METTRVKRVIFSLCLIAMAGLVFTGCKKDPEPAARKISMKVTITVTGANADDQVDFGIGAGNHDASQYGAPVWKVNGVTQGNEDDILLDVDDFVGATQTYVLETVKPFDFGHLNAGCSNDLGGNPITMSYKVEVDGKVETNVENLVVAAGQSHNKNYSYQAK